MSKYKFRGVLFHKRFLFTINCAPDQLATATENIELIRGTFSHNSKKAFAIAYQVAVTLEDCCATINHLLRFRLPSVHHIQLFRPKLHLAPFKASHVSFPPFCSPIPLLFIKSHITGISSHTRVLNKSVMNAREVEVQMSAKPRQINWSCQPVKAKFHYNSDCTLWLPQLKWEFDWVCIKVISTLLMAVLWWRRDNPLINLSFNSPLKVKFTRKNRYRTETTNDNKRTETRFPASSRDQPWEKAGSKHKGEQINN